MTGQNTGLLRQISRILPVFILFAAIYAGWIFYSRWNNAREIQRANAARERERARKDVEINGGSRLKIIMLYVSEAADRKGHPAQICYGVVNAKNVAFNPPVADVWPSMNRCVEVVPRKSTTYTLTADDGSGHSETAQVLVPVK